jgi:hypothetical protein
MVEIKHLVLAAAVALVLTACDGNAPANNVSAPVPAAKVAPAAPTLASLLALEKSSFEAWKTKDAKFWDTFLSDKFVGWGSSGARLDKAAAAKEYTGSDCDIKSYTLSDAQMKPLGNEAALLTYKFNVDGSCGGQPFPALAWAASVYVREADGWKETFYADAPVVDPSATAPKPADTKPAPAAESADPASGDADTTALLAVEKQVWEAWRAHDSKRLDALTASDISFINIFGTHFANKADALKDWSGAGCDARSVSVTGAEATMLSPTVGILTFKGGADGTCFGQKIGPILGTSIYVRDSDAWKWTFGINLPAH